MPSFSVSGTEHAEVIDSILDGHNTLAILPPGSVQALCHQLRDECLPGLTVVVSPLISSTKDETEISGNFIFTTPERLIDREFLTTLQQATVNLVIVDEAHRISQRSHDFSPAFHEIPRIIRLLDKPRVLALTAGATDHVIEDIGKHLAPKGMRLLRNSLYRNNLQYSVIHITNEAERHAALRQVLSETRGAGIIYCSTVKSARAVHQVLCQAGEHVALYHDKLSVAQRAQNRSMFMSGESRAMVATNAFGTDVDRPDIRFVIHMQMPDSFEAYFQESGRAGRDGKDARCVMLYHVNDIRMHRYFLSGHYPDAKEIARIYAAAVDLAVKQPKIRQKHIEDMLGNSVAHRKLQIALRLLMHHKILTLNASGYYKVAIDSLDEAAFEKKIAAYRERAKHDRKTLARMESYAQSGQCRWHSLCEYFGDSRASSRCGHCDNCLRIAGGLPPKWTAPHLTMRDSASLSFRCGELVQVRRYGRCRVEDYAENIVSLRCADGMLRDFRCEYVKSLRR